MKPKGNTFELISKQLARKALLILMLLKRDT